jgi:hypothetical protein
MTNGSKASLRYFLDDGDYYKKLVVEEFNVVNLNSMLFKIY